MRPLIGITCAWSVETWGDSVDGGGYYYVGVPYVRAISKYGGIPFLVAPEYGSNPDKTVAEILDKVNGLLFSGGGDAKRFAPDQLPTLEEQQPKRYRFESKLMKEAWKRGMPILGICRGHQMIAEVFGGSIAKDTVENHKQNLPGSEPWHDVTIDMDSKLFVILGKQNWKVNSFHRQVIGDIPNGFRPVAKASKDIIEGIESVDNHFFMGFQFHPEELAPVDDTAQQIFKEFIKAAKEYKGGA